MGGRSIKFCSPKSASSYSWVLVPSYREENLSPSLKKKKTHQAIAYRYLVSALLEKEQWG